MAEPLSYDQIWGEPDDFQEDRAETDRAMEEILSGHHGFDDAHWCTLCGHPAYLCQCGLINQGEDY